MRTPTRRRTAVPAALLLVTALGAADAHAALRRPKPLCNLVTDPADLSSSPSLDILSADLATNKTALTWVVRVTDADSTTDNSTALGRSWTFVYRVGDRQITQQVLDGPFGLRDGSGNQAKVVLDTVTNQVRYTVPLATISSAYGVTVVPGKSVFKDLAASASALVQLPEAAAYNQPLPDGDTTTSSVRSYPAGSSSCVTVG